MTTRVEITFPHLDEGWASDAIGFVVEALVNHEGLNQLAANSGELTRTFEVKLADPTLVGVDGMTYEVQVGAPGTARMTSPGGPSGGWRSPT